MFDFANYYDVALNLAKISDEANIRSAISRYYYAGFCSVRNYLVEILHEQEFSNGYNVHKRICDRLIASNDNTEVSIGEKLNDLKELRNMADYDWAVDLDFFNENLYDVQYKSRIILQEINALKSSPPFRL